MARKRIVQRETEDVSRQVRVYSDVADMLRWVCDMQTAEKGVTVTMAGYLDPLIRPQIEADYARFAKKIETIKKAMG